MGSDGDDHDHPPPQCSPCFLRLKVHFVWLEASVFLVGGGDGDHDHLPPKENDDQQGK